MPNQLREIGNLINEASFLSDEERNLLMDVVQFWPNEELPGLLEALQGESETVVSPESPSVGELKERLQQSTVEFKKVPRQAPVVQSIPKPAPKPQPAPRPRATLPERPRPIESNGRGVEFVSTSADFRTLTVDDVRHGSFRDNLKMLIQKVSSISQKEGILPYHITSTLNGSPLYSAYLETGTRLLSGDDNAPMTRQEFEDLTDFEDYLSTLS